MRTETTSSGRPALISDVNESSVGVRVSLRKGDRSRIRVGKSFYKFCKVILKNGSNWWSRRGQEKIFSFVF